MKKMYSSLILVLLLAFNATAQTISRNRQLGDLAKVWGLLKYYHPEVAKGKYDWDSTMILSARKILTGNGRKSFTESIDRLINIAGPDTADAYMPNLESSIMNQNLDYRWIDRSDLLNKKQKQYLRFIISHPNRKGNVYATPADSLDSYVITPNEKPYKEMHLPDVNYRLLGLFRFWNVIHYYYPYKYAIGSSWDHMLNKFIPKMIQATDTLSYHKAIAQMAASINDSHGGLWPEVYKSIAGKYSPPFYFRLVGRDAVITKVNEQKLEEAGLQAGTIITGMNGISVQKLIKKYSDYIPASNAGGKLKSMHAFIFNTFSAKAQYQMVRPDGKKVEATIKQSERNFLKEYLSFFDMESKDTCKIIGDDVGYVYFGNLTNSNTSRVMKSLMKTKAIIFDMRNYPVSGAGIYWAPDYLLSEPHIYAKNTCPDFSLPGKFNYTVANEGTAFPKVGKQNISPYKGRIILLVDYRTQSAAEWACMTLMTAKNVTVIGNQTAGADGNVTHTVIPGGYRIAFSGLGIYWPNGGETQRIGIPIDIKVSYSPEDLINNRDPLMVKAIEFINSPSN